MNSREYLVHIVHPFSIDKDYGTVLNRTFEMIPENDWVCILDWDCMFLHPNQIVQLYNYIDLYPDTGMFLAKSNRSGSQQQRYQSSINPNTNMNYWHRHGANNKDIGVVEITNNAISGYFMLVSKKTWLAIKFSAIGILGVDRDYAGRLLSVGKKILLTNILVWHSYRVWNGGSKTHLE